MLTPSLPQSGFVTAAELSEALGIEETTFRDNVRRDGLPYRTFGRTMLLELPAFYLAWRSNETESERGG